MKVTQRIAYALITLFAAALLAACNFPNGNPDSQPDTTSEPPESEGDSEATEEVPVGGGQPESDETPSDVDPAPANETSAPAGWTAYSDSDLNVALYMPPGWEAVVVNDTKLDIREVDGFAWFEINIITTETDDSWSLVYNPGTAPNAILSELVRAAQDDGDFDDPYELSASVWATQGVYDVLEEPVFIGAVDQSERLLLALGHARESDDWGGVYLPLYESMIQTITIAN